MIPPTPERGRAAGISYLRRQGVGDPVVLLHGIGSNAESWQRLFSAFYPWIDAVAWDAPGYGRSEALTQAAPAPGDYADRLEALLDALGLYRVVLVGHSLGTLFAARFAASRPERVSAVALLSPALGYGVAAGDALPAAAQARIDDLEQLGAVEFAARRAAKLIYRAADKPAVLAGVRRSMAEVRLPGYAQAVRALGAGTLLADAALIAAPTLVAVGAEDVVTPPANARAVHDVLRRKTPLHVIPAAGHALPQEAPATLARLLTPMLMEGSHV